MARYINKSVRARTADWGAWSRPEIHHRINGLVSGTRRTAGRSLEKSKGRKELGERLLKHREESCLLPGCFQLSGVSRQTNAGVYFVSYRSQQRLPWAQDTVSGHTARSREAYRETGPLWDCSHRREVSFHVLQWVSPQSKVRKEAEKGWGGESRSLKK